MFDNKNDGSKYLQLYNYYKKLILDGVLKSNDKIPSIRKCAESFELSRTTVETAYEMLGAETVTAYLEKGIIEIAPLAYMRGRTLDNSFIILDEAQNTTNEQMKMFLTRIGFNSKVVVTGDRDGATCKEFGDYLMETIEKL